MPSDAFTLPAAWSTTISPIAYRRSRDWTNTTGYRNVPRDDLPVNVYNDTKQHFHQNWCGGAYVIAADGSLSKYDLRPGFLWTGAQLQSEFFKNYQDSGWTSQVANAQAGLTLKALGEIADMKANLAVAFAEAGKTSEQILSTATRIDNAMRALRRKDYKRVARELGISSKTRHKTWLEYKYGWMPLLMDVKGTAELFAQHVLGRPLRFSVQAKNVLPVDWTRAYPYSPIYGGGSGTGGKEYRTLSGTFTTRIKIWCEITNPHIAALQQMGLTNPALIAWEVVPYSFVFDWFIHVGDWLTALSALHGVTVRRAMKSELMDFAASFYFPSTKYTQSSGATCIAEERRWNGRHRQYGRSVPTLDPLQIPIPRGWDHLGFPKLITSLALLKGTGAGRTVSNKAGWLI